MFVVWVRSGVMPLLKQCIGGGGLTYLLWSKGSVRIRARVRVRVRVTIKVRGRVTVRIRPQQWSVVPSLPRCSSNRVGYG